LEGFLSAVLGQDISVQELLESEGNQKNESDKQNRVDLLVKDKRGQLILIEVQIEREHDFFHRMAYGTAKLVTQYMTSGQNYGEIKKVISINITYFSLGEGKDYAYHGSTVFVGMNHKDTLRPTDTQKTLYRIKGVHEIFAEYYLLRIKDFDDHVGNPLDEWVYMMKNDEVEPGFTSKHIQKAGERLKYISLKNKARQEYDRYLENLRYHASMEETRRVDMEMAIKEGREEGIKEGREEGQHAEKIITARKLLQMGMSASQIVGVTGLPEGEIEQLGDE